MCNLRLHIGVSLCDDWLQITSSGGGPDSGAEIE
jgi:hypothetical protein